MLIGHQEALEHFGFTELQLPACIEVLTEGEKAIVWARRIAEKHAEELHSKVHELDYQLWDQQRHWRRFGDARDVFDAVNNWESMQSRALAAEAALKAGPKWLASLLRWNAERLGKIEMRRRQRFLQEVRREQEKLRAEAQNQS